ncbi:MAG: Crp/Fnr family transcriptional regulator [Gammaproteobacteria bacterium]|nr:Crp/Fnr family transcriptional regulator [Gammaproteobacteria bacterium]MBL7000828.1 Crp/Fnr family transcriptional regulator [Gammaproteobacteria bacterium]
MDTKSTSHPGWSRIEELMQMSPLFSSLDKDQMATVIKHSRVNSLNDGEMLFHRGDKVHNFYFVLEGLIKIYRQSPTGQEKIIELEKPGQTFGEALMFFDHPTYPVSAIAMEASTLLCINASAFLEVLQNSATVCIKVMGSLSHRLHEQLNEIEYLSLLTGRNRIAMYFLDQSMRQGMEFKLEVPKNAIASMLSLQPETFSRLIKELANNQVIEIQESNIRVLDQDLLRKYAGIV